MANLDANFDEILEEVGNSGRFQRRYNVLYNLGAICFASMSYMSIILALNKPPYNCHVPGMERYNISDLEVWKNLTLPRETDNRGDMGYSKCQMYNVTEEHLQRPYGEWNFQPSDVIDCAHGYDYDRTYYDRTPITEYDWVCDKGIRETNVFVYNRLGELVGTFIFGYLGDTLGRRPVFYLSVLIITSGRFVAMFTAAYYVAFCVASFAGSLSAYSVFQSPFIIAMEISRGEDRGHISIMQSLGWTSGLCILPMVFWATKDWFWALMITSMPILAFLLIPGYMIESPRWLATRGHYGRAARELRRIATVNGKANAAEKMNEATLEQRLSGRVMDQVYGIPSLFKGWRMARNTILVILCVTVGSVTYFTLVLLSSRMDGNPFVNFALQGLIEMPAYLIGQQLSDRLGRRFTNAISFGLAALTCGIQVFVVRNASHENLSTALTTFIKFCVSITFFALNLQSVEIYPTSLRQTGMAVGTTASTIFGILGPYVVYLGTEYDVRYPYLVMGLSSVIGLIAASFLPETLHQSLPENIVEAQIFGKEQRFWSLPKKPKAKGTAERKASKSWQEMQETVGLNVPEEGKKEEDE